jgi:carboxypeptidase C (cathepsin A)
VGRLDSRYLGIDRDAAGDTPSYDPSMAAIDGPFSTALAAYLKGDLKFSIDRTYETLTGRVHPWKYPEGRYADVSERLRSAMTKNRSLRVFVASGTLDLATPYFAADYTLRHLMLDSTLRGNVHVRYYDAGHMMYIHAPSRRKLRDDVAAFYSLR